MSVIQSPYLIILVEVIHFHLYVVPLNVYVSLVTADHQWIILEIYKYSYCKYRHNIKANVHGKYSD